MKRFKITYLWNNVMICYFDFSAKNLTEAKADAEEWRKCKERIRGIKCQILSVVDKTKLRGKIRLWKKS